MVVGATSRTSSLSPRKSCHGRLRCGQRVAGEAVGKEVRLLLLAQCRRMLLGKQALAVCTQRREGLAVELRARCAGDGRAEQRRAELLARAVIRRDEARRLLLEVHQLAVFHDLARQREAVLPGHVLQELAEAFLHTIHGIVAVLADRLEALHRGHGRELLAPVVAGGDVEQLRQHAGPARRPRRASPGTS